MSASDWVRAPDDPLGPIPVSGVLVEFVPFVQVPATHGSAPRARLSVLRPDPSEPGLLWVNDQRGPLYFIQDSNVEEYFNLRDRRSDFVDSPGLGSGFQSFAIHPEYANNGRFYTVHTESGGSAPADFTGPSVTSSFIQGIVTEWTDLSPGGSAFVGFSRELLRIDFPHQFHGIQEVAFNPNAGPGSPDYGLLYVTIGDGGAFNEGIPGDLMRLDSLYGTILRIDPRGSDGLSGEYGIPADNPFVDAADPEVLAEIYAYGFRNPHRIVFQPSAQALNSGDPLIFVNEIGEDRFEEINQLLPGANYGWPEREGTYRFRPESTQFRSHSYELPDNDETLGFTYPVVQWDRSPGNGSAIGSGIFYNGSDVPALRGHYVTADIRDGMLYHFPLSSLDPGGQAPIYEFQIEGPDGQRQQLGQRYTGRVDLRLGVDHGGEMYAFTKNDGAIYRLKGISKGWEMYPVADGWVDTMGWMGRFFIEQEAWVFSERLNRWVYWPHQDQTEGAWFYAPR
ncbi:MAG: PQQ-dependent sugar dehydrogenase [Opitutales bacterium]|nr:PQQ-dependent sugar dehydrogenase [Opitutales bacterium]